MTYAYDAGWGWQWLLEAAVWLYDPNGEEPYFANMVWVVVHVAGEDIEGEPAENLCFRARIRTAGCTSFKLCGARIGRRPAAVGSAPSARAIRRKLFNEIVLPLSSRRTVNSPT